MSKVTVLLSVFVLGLVFGSSALGQRLSAEQATEKIRLATPADLPQVPVVKKGRSDAWDVGLKGTVKEVVTLVGEVGSRGLSMFLKEEFDKDGALVKQTSYDEYGNPRSVTVYGYIDGKRVAKAGYIDYDYNPPAPPAPPWVQANAKNKRDPRYFYAYEYDYDSKGELTEKRHFGNDGNLTFRIVYTRNGSKREQTHHNGRTQPWPGTTETFDEAGNLIEKVIPLANPPPITTQYKYELFDQTGNWTRRTATTRSRSRTSTEAQVRTISYY